MPCFGLSPVVSGVSGESLVNSVAAMPTTARVAKRRRLRTLGVTRTKAPLIAREGERASLGVVMSESIANATKRRFMAGMNESLANCVAAKETTAPDSAQWGCNEGKLGLLHWMEESFAWRGQMRPSVDFWQGGARALQLALQRGKQRLQWRKGEDFAQWEWDERKLGLLHCREESLASCGQMRPSVGF